MFSQLSTIAKNIRKVQYIKEVNKMTLNMMFILAKRGREYRTSIITIGVRIAQLV
jgi:hypothetical protein